MELHIPHLDVLYAVVYVSERCTIGILAKVEVERQRVAEQIKQPSCATCRSTAHWWVRFPLLHNQGNSPERRVKWDTEPRALRRDTPARYTIRAHEVVGSLLIRTWTGSVSVCLQIELDTLCQGQ